MVLKSAAHFGNIAELHHRIAARFNGDLTDIGLALDQTGHGERKEPLTAINTARRNKLIIARQNRIKLIGGDVVVFHRARVDDNFQHFLALADQLGLQYIGHAGNFFLEHFGMAIKLALTVIARQIDHNDRKQTGIELAHIRLFRVIGQF